MLKPSEITDPGWYWAEERIGDDYQLTVMEHYTYCGEQRWSAMDDHWYDAAAADAWFRIICRIDEPEVRGGWA